MAQQLRIFADLAEDPGSVPSTYILLTTVYKSSSRASGILFWPLSALYAHGAYPLQAEKNAYTLKINK